jgi:hypothetical protein
MLRTTAMVGVRAARVSVWGIFLQREGRTRASACHGAFIGRRSKPRHGVEPGEIASERAGRARRRAVVHAERRDEDELLQLFLDEGVPRARLGCTGPVLVGLLVGSCGQVS